MESGSRIFKPCRSLGYVSNHIPLKVRFIKSRKENLIVTCVGKSFHTYGISHFGLLSVSGLHENDITALASDTFHVYTACGNDIYAWRRGTELKHTYKTHKKTVHLILPFGVHLITVDESSCLKVWDIKDESLFLELTFSNSIFQITTILHPHTYINKILLGSKQGEMQLWNLNHMKMIYSFKSFDSAITSMEQSPAIDIIAVGLANGKIILHNLKTDKTLMEFIQDWGLVSSIAFRLDGAPIMATGSTAGHIVFWDLEERRVSSQLMGAHNGSVTGMVGLPNEPLLLTSSPDNTLKLWIFDMADGGARLLRIREGHFSPPSHIRFYGLNGHNILSAGGDSSLRIFNTQNEQFNKSLGRASYNRKISKKSRKGQNDPLIMAPITHFSHQTTREKEWDNIAAIHETCPLVTTWSYHKLKMGEHKLLPERFHRKKLVKQGFKDVMATSIFLTHCGNFITIGYNSGHLDRFNIQSGLWRDSYGNPKAHDAPITGIVSDSLNQLTISGDNNSKIKFWKFKSKGVKPLSIVTLDGPISFFHIQNDSSILAIATENFDISILDIHLRRIIRKLIGHNGQITDMAFSPDQQWLITSSMDCSIRIWDIPTSQLIDQLLTDTACISLTMSQCGDILATAHVNSLGINLWTNCQLYKKLTLKALTVSDDGLIEIDSKDSCDEDFMSMKQLSQELVTLSDLSSSYSQNLVNLDIIRKRNILKASVKKPKHAPFFLPTVAALNFQFDLSEQSKDTTSKLLFPKNLQNLTSFGIKLSKSDFNDIITELKGMSPSMVNFEIKALTPEGGGSIDLMGRFLLCIEFMLKSNVDFELAQAYLGSFLKMHGNVIAKESVLRNYLNNVQSCHSVVWHRIQSQLLYSISVVQNLKHF